MSRRVSEEKKRAIRDLGRTGRTQREIAEIVGASKGTVAAVLRPHWLTPAPSSRHASAPRIAPTVPALPKTPVVPAEDPARAARLLELEAAERAADTGAAWGVAHLAARRFHDPKLDAMLTAGKSKLDALTSFDNIDCFLLTEPEDLAELAVIVTEDVYGWEPEEGETEEDFATFVASRKSEAHQRAVGLLEAAVAILRSGAPS